MEWKHILQRLLIMIVGVAIAAHLVGDIHYEKSGDLIIVVLVLAVLNVILRPLMVLLALPFVIMTLGVGFLIINALLFQLTDFLVPGFHVDGFWAAFWGAFWVSLTGLIANLLIAKPKIEIHSSHSPGSPPPGHSRTHRDPRLGSKSKDDDDVIDI